MAQATSSSSTSSSSAPPSHASAVKSIKNNVLYIDAAPLANCQVACAQAEAEAHKTMGSWRGQDGLCIFTNDQSAQASGAHVDRGGYNDPGQRCKIPQRVWANGTEIDLSLIRAAAAKGGWENAVKASVVPNRPTSAFPQYDNSKRVTIQHVVLKVYHPQLFARLLRWVNGEIDPNVTWMIGHRCSNGNYGCIQPRHLFLVTGSVNQKQRNCVVPKLKPCEACGYFAAVTECYCTKHLAGQNTAMPDGNVPLCISHGACASKLVEENAKLRIELASALDKLKKMEQA